MIAALRGFPLGVLVGATVVLALCSIAYAAERRERRRASHLTPAAAADLAARSQVGQQIFSAGAAWAGAGLTTDWDWPEPPACGTREPRRPSPRSPGSSVTLVPSVVPFEATATWGKPSGSGVTQTWGFELGQRPTDQRRLSLLHPPDDFGGQ